MSGPQATVQEWSAPPSAVPSVPAALSWGRVFLALAIGYFILQHGLFVPGGPFLRGGVQVGAEDVANGPRQIVWPLLLMAALPLGLCVLDRVRRLALAMPLLTAALVWSWASVTWAVFPIVSLKRVMLLTVVTLVFMIGAAAVRKPAELWRPVALVLAGIIGIDVVSAVFVPVLGREDSGAFVGLHASKNTAGAISAMALMVWFFAGRFMPEWRVTRVLVLFGGVVFLVGTDSKTSMAALLASGGIAWGLTVLARTGPLTVAAGLWLLLALLAAGGLAIHIATPAAVLTALFGDATLTGRTDLWGFLWPFVGERPWTGMGYQSLWLTGGVGVIERWSPSILNWAVHQAHNGYLDLLLTIGVVGLVLLTAGVVAGVVRALAMEAAGRAPGCGTLAVAVLVFALIHNATESSLLRGDHTVWGFTFLALLSASLGGPVWRRNRNT